MKTRRLHSIVILVVAFLFVVVAAGQAQSDPPVQPDNDLIIIHDLPKDMIDGVAEPFTDSFLPDNIAIPLTLEAAEEPSDLCEDAPSLIMFPTNPADGGVANVSNATVSNDDPVLACQWGNPSRAQAYRTVWYKFFAPVNGRVTIDTFNSNYDTVLGISTGTCGALNVIRCNDDFNLFSSQVTFAVNGGETYYVEVADRNPNLPQPAHMQLSALLLPVDSLWTQETTNPGPPPVSRHAVVAYNQYLYVIGGQTGDRQPGELPQISNRLLRFDTNTLHWADIPPATLPVGYSNTTAALVGNKIYVPTGYSGNDLAYDGLHWIYDIAANSWNTAYNKTPTFSGEHYAWASAAVPPTNNKYYLTGGLSSPLADIPPGTVENKVVRDTYVYLPEADGPNSNPWVPQKPMQAGRYAHTSAWIEANNLGLCVAGGLGVQTDAGQLVTVLQSSAECYQPGGDWHFIGDLNVPRYGAGSAVGPDGKWYVFGGMTAIGSILIPTPVTEVYDPVRNTWSVLSPAYNLGNFETLPPRFWPRGATVGNNIWVVGGSIFNEGERAVPIVERLPLASNTNYIPVLGSNYNDATNPDDTFADARPIAFGINQSRNFDQQRDFFDVYTFEITSFRNIQVRLIVPDNNNFDVAVYGRQKTEWNPGAGTNPRQGADEVVVINNLPPNRYYIVVTRVYPTGQPDKGAYYTLGLQ